MQGISLGSLNKENRMNASDESFRIGLSSFSEVQTLPSYNPSPTLPAPPHTYRCYRRFHLRHCHCHIHRHRCRMQLGQAVVSPQAQSFTGSFTCQARTARRSAQGLKSAAHFHTTAASSARRAQLRGHGARTVHSVQCAPGARCESDNGSASGGRLAEGRFMGGCFTAY